MFIFVNERMVAQSNNYFWSLRVGSGISSFINFGETKERIEKGNGHELLSGSLFRG